MNLDDLKLIKRFYGEGLMHLCRDLFPTILETKGLLFQILSTNFAPTRSLYDDIKEYKLESEFQSFINSFIDPEKEIVKTDKTPFELLEEKDYILYECKTEEDVQKFRKYYQKDEEICTFWTNRTERCHVFFAIRTNAIDLKREDFKDPKRQDEYGISVISIQFTKGKTNTLSIKNRYNHTVDNPDATFSNNLDNIIPGLTYSFSNFYNFNIESNKDACFLTDVLWYVLAGDSKYYRVNYELNGINYCENNIIIDNGKLIDMYNHEKERYILVDYFIIDKKEKKIFLYDETIYDTFPDSIHEVGTIKEIITKDREIIIEYEDNKRVIITLDNNNNIIGYQNDYIENIKSNFLHLNQVLKNISLKNVVSIGNNFLLYNDELTSITLANVKTIRDNFFNYNKVLNKINLPSVESIGNNFLFYNKSLTSINLSSVLNIGDDFLLINKTLVNIDLSKVLKIGDNFLFDNICLTSIDLSNVKEIGCNFMFQNLILDDIKIPNVLKIGSNYLTKNKIINKYEIDKVLERNQENEKSRNQRNK